MEVVICGTSNSLIRDGYVWGIREHPAVSRLCNYATGGSTSVLLPRVGAECDTENFDFVVFDFSPNEDFFHLRNLSSPAEIERRLLDFLSRHMSAKTIPVMVVMPMVIGFAEDRKMHLGLLEICRKNGIIVLDGYKFIKKACRLTGSNHRIYFSDRDHLKREVAHFFGEQVANVLSRIDRSKIARRETAIEVPAYQFVSLTAPDSEAAIARRTSVCGSHFVAVGQGEGPKITLDAPATLIGAGVNVAQSSGQLVALSGPNRTSIPVTHAHLYRPDQRDNIKSLVYMVRPTPELEGETFEFRAGRREGEDGLIEMSGAVFRGPATARTYLAPVLPDELRDIDLEISDAFVAHIESVLKKTLAATVAIDAAPPDASTEEIERRCVLATGHIKAGDLFEAEKALAGLSPDGGDIPNLSHVFATLHMARRDFKRAEAILSEALATNPGHLGLMRTLFRLHVSQAKFAEALACVKDADWSELTSDELHSLGRSALKCKQNALAVSAMEACIARGSPSANNYALLSTAFYAMKDFERVLSTCEKLFELEPNRANSIREYARVLKYMGRFEEALPHFVKLRDLSPADSRSHIELGWAYMDLRRLEEARDAFEGGLAQHPDNTDLLFELGRAQARLGDRRAAFENFERALKRDPGHLKAGLEYVRQAMTMRKFEIAKSAAENLIAVHPAHPDVLFEFGRMSLETAAPERARECFLKALALKPKFHQSHYRLAQLALRERNIDEAVERYSAAIAIEPDRISYRIDRARALLALDRLEDAAKDARHALRFEPRNPKALQIVKLVDGLFGENNDPAVAVAFFQPGAEAAAFGARLSQVAAPHRAFAPGAGENRLAEPASEALAALFSVSDAGWLGLIEDADRAEAALRLLADGKTLSAYLKHVGPSVGLVEIGPQDAPGVVLYRREFLHFVFDAAPILNGPYMDLLKAHHDKIRAVQIDPTGKLTRRRPEAKAKEPREVFLISRHGIELYGGGEQFLRGMSKVYRGLGYAPLIVGMRNDVPQVIYGERDNERFAEIQPMPADVFALALVHEPAVVHVLSGLGYEVVTPLKYLHLHTVYGTHFWRDMYEEIGGYLDIDRHAVPKREYHALIENASVIYSNSHFTAEMKRKHFGFSTPIVYSLTDDVATEPSPPGDYALLVNARPEKGFDLILEVAKRAPKARFLVIASQSPVAQAEEMVAAAGVTNIKVIGRTSKMEETYRGARVVLVPSYAFIETFSRVVIEAHRLGVPVVGSDRGNVPYLLTESGVALPEDADAWAKELTRLFTDDGYHAARRRMALENSQRYAFARQPERIRRILGYCNNRILVAVGAGLGNIVQTSPLLRRMSEHFGHSIDVVVKEDFKGCSYLAAGAPWVNMVFPLGRNVLQREYDLVYVTHSFGDLIPSFNSNKTIAARRHYPFGMTQNMHESEFNLFCAEKLLGIPYEKGDAAKYFVASAEKSQLPNGVIALHSGGKGGEWAGGWLNKRWPYYRDLVVELQRRGFKVASFGVKDEYVEGTIDMTGTSLPVTIQNLSRCSYFIGNDSGVMHIADGLGVPLTTIFGPTSVVKNGPLAPTSSVLELKKECAPCQFDEKRFSTCTCISEITLERYLEHILAHMAEIGVLAELQAEPADAAE